MKSVLQEARKRCFDVTFLGNDGKSNILILTEYVNATYFISFDIPLRAMHERGELNVAVASQARVEQLGHGCWNDMLATFRPDVVIISRYAKPFGVEMLQFFKGVGVPVIYHIDDDLLEIPDSLGHDIRKRNGSWIIVESRRQMLAEADLIYASTPSLAARLSGRFPTQSLFHGIYAPYMGDGLPPSSRAPGHVPTIGYMGSKGHQRDLQLVVPDLIRLMTDRPDTRFETFGTISMPPDLLIFADRVEAHAVNKSYAAFLQSLAGLNWDLGLAPLVDEPFNQCKAPTKFIEYSAAGIPVVASDVLIYRDLITRGGGALVTSSDWYGAIDSMLEAPERRGAAVFGAQGLCRREFSKGDLERQVWQVLESVGVSRKL